MKTLSVTTSILIAVLCMSSSVIPASSDTEEILVYELRLKPFVTAIAEFRNTYSPSSPHLLCVQASVSTHGLAQAIFPIHNRYQVWIDTRTQLPLRSAKQIEQKNISQKLEIHYDHERNEAKTDRGETWTIRSGCQTLFSIFPYLRTLSIERGDSLAFTLEIESHLWLLTGHAETDQLSDNTEPLMLLSFHFEQAGPNPSRSWKTDLLTNRISRPDTRLEIWLQKTEPRIPLRILFKNDRFRVDMRLREDRGGERD